MEYARLSVSMGTTDVLRGEPLALLHCHWLAQLLILWVAWWALGPGVAGAGAAALLPALQSARAAIDTQPLAPNSSSTTACAPPPPPPAVVQYAAKRVQREHVKGSATCCVVLIDMLQVLRCHAAQGPAAAWL